MAPSGAELHIQVMHDALGDQTSAVGHRPGKAPLQVRHKMAQPSLVMLPGKRLAIIQGTVFCHHMALIFLLAQQHFVPVLADGRQVLLQINPRHLQKHRRHDRILQQALIKPVHHGVNIFPAIQVRQVTILSRRFSRPKNPNRGHYFLPVSA